MRKYLTAFVILASVHSVFAAADQVISVPAGWYLDPVTSPVEIGPGLVATVAYQGDPITASRVIVTQGAGSAATTSQTDLPGWVWSISLSPSGSVVANYSVGTDARVSLIDPPGTLSWTRQDGRKYSFSNDGGSLLAIAVNDDSGYRAEFEIRDLAGARVTQTDMRSGEGTPVPIAGILLIGNGSECFTVAHSSLAKMKLSTNETLWQAEPAVFDAAPISVEWASSNIVVRMRSGRFKVFSPQGSLLYYYNPNQLSLDAQENEQLELTGPVKNVGYFGSYRPFGSLDSNTLFLFNRTANAYSLDLTTGELTERIIDVSAPPGFVMREIAPRQRLIMVSATAVRVRTVSF